MEKNMETTIVGYIGFRVFIRNEKKMLATIMGSYRDYYKDPFLHVRLWEPGLANIGVD